MTIDNEEYKHARACCKFVEDAAAYLNQEFSGGHDANVILITLAHDIMGLANRERCFLPRVSGYAERAK